MDRGPGAGGGGRVDAAWLLDAARKLLDARDLVGSKTFAERAMEADPLLDGIDRVLAVADVLLAAQRRRINNHADLYAVLQLDPSAGGRDTCAVRLQYSRLARLLHPDHRQGSDCFLSPSYSEAANEAFKLVSDAWAVLSDPMKKELYDKEIDIAAGEQTRPNGGSVGGHHSGDSIGKKASARTEVNATAAFWTACTSCFNLHQFACGYEGRTLLCQNCKKAFQATEMASSPPIVPGTDMYFCAWGLFPLGFPGGPNFALANGLNCANGPEVGRDISGEPWKHSPPSQPKKQKRGFSAAKRGKAHGNAVKENVAFDEATGSPSTTAKSPKKTRQKVMANRPTRQVRQNGVYGIASSGGDTTVAVDTAAMKEGVELKSDGPRPGFSRAVDVSAEDLDLNFTIDIDATNSILESLSTLPFLKDEEMVVCERLLLWNAASKNSHILGIG